MRFTTILPQMTRKGRRISWPLSRNWGQTCAKPPEPLVCTARGHCVNNDFYEPIFWAFSRFFEDLPDGPPRVGDAGRARARAERHLGRAEPKLHERKAMPDPKEFNRFIGTDGYVV